MASFESFEVFLYPTNLTGSLEAILASEVRSSVDPLKFLARMRVSQSQGHFCRVKRTFAGNSYGTADVKQRVVCRRKPLANSHRIFAYFSGSFLAHFGPGWPIPSQRVA